jgi:hypothetical protein
MDYFGPFEILSLFIFLGCSFTSLSLAGRSGFFKRIRDWWSLIRYANRRTKPSIYTLYAILVYSLLALALTGWGVWVSPIHYADIGDNEEAQELISVWDENRSFWKFCTILVLDLAALIVLPHWYKSVFWWMRFDLASLLSSLLFVLGGLLTGFGYAYYWPIGLGYSFFELAMIYLMVNDGILLYYNGRDGRNPSGDDDEEEEILADVTAYEN